VIFSRLLKGEGGSLAGLECPTDSGPRKARLGQIRASFWPRGGGRSLQSRRVADRPVQRHPRLSARPRIAVEPLHQAVFPQEGVDWGVCLAHSYRLAGGYRRVKTDTKRRSRSGRCWSRSRQAGPHHRGPVRWNDPGGEGSPSKEAPQTRASRCPSRRNHRARGLHQRLECDARRSVQQQTEPDAHSRSGWSARPRLRQEWRSRTRTCEELGGHGQEG
jgi:hypothetical protein